jgi:hypothetical protein
MSALALGRAFLRVDCSYVGSSLDLGNSPVFGRVQASYALLHARVGTVMGNNSDIAFYGTTLVTAIPILPTRCQKSRRPSQVHHWIPHGHRGRGSNQFLTTFQSRRPLACRFHTGL